MQEFVLDTRDTKLTCRKYGNKGDVLILIHGACVDADFFHETAVTLSYSFIVYTFDRRGYGRNERTEFHDFNEQVQDIKQLLDYIKQPCHIVAHSAGTVLAMLLSIKYPERIRTLFLYEPVLPHLINEHTEYLKLFKEMKKNLDLKRYSKMMGMFRLLIGENDMRARAATEDEYKHMRKNYMCFFTYEFEQIYNMKIDYEKIRIPVIVGIGEQSRNSARYEMAEILAEKTKGNLLYFPGGHNCPYDLPKEFAFMLSGMIRTLI